MHARLRASYGRRQVSLSEEKAPERFRHASNSQLSANQERGPCLMLDICTHFAEATTYLPPIISSTQHIIMKFSALVFVSAFATGVSAQDAGPGES